MNHIGRGLVIAVALCPFYSGAQPLFTELGGGVGLQGVQFIGKDTMANRLFLAGAFTYANEVQVSPGILMWDGTGLHSVGCGVEWDCEAFINEAGLLNPALAVVVWNGDLFLGGNFFFTLDGIDYDRLMRWDGVIWHPVPGLDGSVKSIKIIDDQLIVAGLFTYADTVLANGLARWDSTGWHRVVDVPQFYSGDINRVQDVEKFQGEWYLGGNMSEMHELAKYNGTTWEIVGGGFLGSFAQVNRLQAHGDRLYVAGSFAQCPPLGIPTNPGSGIVAWDGTSWDDLGGGTCGASNGAVNSILWWNDDLYVTGLFDRMGGQQGQGLAKWNGTEWCMLVPPGYWGTGGPGALAVFHDSLYIGGAFLVAGEDSASCFGKWTGGAYTYSCGAITGSEEHILPGGVFLISPNPATASITLQGLPPTASALLIHDVLGRTVHRANARSSVLDIEPLSNGTYTVQVLDEKGSSLGTVRFIKH